MQSAMPRMESGFYAASTAHLGGESRCCLQRVRRRRLAGLPRRDAWHFRHRAQRSSSRHPIVLSDAAPDRCRSRSACHPPHRAARSPSRCAPGDPGEVGIFLPSLMIGLAWLARGPSWQSLPCQPYAFSAAVVPSAQQRVPADVRRAACCGAGSRFLQRSGRLTPADEGAHEEGPQEWAPVKGLSYSRGIPETGIPICDIAKKSPCHCDPGRTIRH